MMGTKNENIYLVANLQVYASPYASLYINKEHNVLYLFVRISQPTVAAKYVVADVSAKEIEQYISKRRKLTSMFANRPLALAEIESGKVCMERALTFKPTEEMRCSDTFDPEYFYDKLKLRSFLRRYNNNITV